MGENGRGIVFFFFFVDWDLNFSVYQGVEMLEHWEDWNAATQPVLNTFCAEVLKIPR